MFLHPAKIDPRDHTDTGVAASRGNLPQNVAPAHERIHVRERQRILKKVHDPAAIHHERIARRRLQVGDDRCGIVIAGIGLAQHGLQDAERTAEPRRETRAGRGCDSRVTRPHQHGRQQHAANQHGAAAEKITPGDQRGRRNGHGSLG